jgi:hypothetical protein
MKKLVVIYLLPLLLLPYSLRAQDRVLEQKLDDVKAQLEKFDTETMLDSLDQEKLPRTVSGGLFAGANMSNFLITRDHNTMSSHMRIGAELGGFMHFNLNKHFVIQPQVILTAQENYFAATDTANSLWSFGIEIPVYFMGVFGNMKNGYVQFGGGIFTHFTYLSNVKNKYKNWDDPTFIPEPKDKTNYSDLYRLHDNHFGVCFIVGYEFNFGMQINAQYKISLSDIAGFYAEKKGTPIADAAVYPQSVSLVVGYRWK